MLYCPFCHWTFVRSSFHHLGLQLFILNTDTNSFIVRIWIESIPEDSEDPTWRGVIEHVGSTERLYFHDFQSIEKFISEKTNIQTKKNIQWLETLKTKIDEIRKKIPILR